ncbi:hypothetical protein PGQ11_005854 [Apiospora arundinis]|uniref:Uncharacterized protein n=1 Tax=Apiospora arundinis TaxID=335852 RepID=A0ABR2IQT7_9PEZI
MVSSDALGPTAAGAERRLYLCQHNAGVINLWTDIPPRSIELFCRNESDLIDTADGKPAKSEMSFASGAFRRIFHAV